MNQILKFGNANPAHRSVNGAILSGDLSEILDFLRRGGILICRYADCSIAVMNQQQSAQLNQSEDGIGFHKLVMGATLINLQKSMELNLTENRILEMLTPGALMLEHEGKSILIPDSSELRDMVAGCGGVMEHCFWSEVLSAEMIAGLLYRTLSNNGRNPMIGTLSQLQKVENAITVTAALTPGQVHIIKEGTIPYTTIVEATERVSHWEIEDWT